MKDVNDSEIQEQFFCCKELPEASIGQDTSVFKSGHKSMSLENCVGKYTDGEPWTICSIRGFISFAKKKKRKEKENPDTFAKHCSIHREMLASKIPKDENKNVWTMLQKCLTLSKKTGSLQNVLKTVKT